MYTKLVLNVKFNDGEADAIAYLGKKQKNYVSPNTGNFYENVYVADYSRSPGFIVFSKDYKILEKNIEGHIGMSVIKELV